jgi:hypothetical protein
MYTTYDRMYGSLSAKNTVYLCMYGFCQPYSFVCVCMCVCVRVCVCVMGVAGKAVVRYLNDLHSR